MKRIGLALGGGGARGLCHIQFCKALDDLGLNPAVISGTSMGAIVGGFYAAGMSGKEMEKLVDKISLLEFTKMLDFAILQPTGLVKGKAVIEFFEKHLPVKTFEELKIPLKIVATDFWHRKEVIFDSGPLIPAIRASISIPAIFVPVKIDGVVLIDGGTVNPLPFDIIKDACDLLIAIDVSGTSEPSKSHPIPSMFESIMTSFQIMETALLKNKMKYVAPDIYMKPDLVNFQVLDFHRDKEIMESVKNDVKQFKEMLKKKISENGEKRIKKKRVFFPFRTCL